MLTTNPKPTTPPIREEAGFWLGMEANSGRVRARARNASALISPSPKPMSMWMPVIAVKPTDHSTVPDHASWPTQASEASTVEHHPAHVADARRDHDVGAVVGDDRRRRAPELDALHGFELPVAEATKEKPVAIADADGVHVVPRQSLGARQRIDQRRDNR